MPASAWHSRRRKLLDICHNYLVTFSLRQQVAFLPGRRQVTKTYNARLGTRITEGVDARLRQLALIRRRRLSRVLDDVLDAAMPPAADLTAQLRRLARAGREARDGSR